MWAARSMRGTLGAVKRSDSSCIAQVFPGLSPEFATAGQSRKRQPLQREGGESPMRVPCMKKHSKFSVLPTL